MPTAGSPQKGEGLSQHSSQLRKNKGGGYLWIPSALILLWRFSSACYKGKLILFSGGEGEDGVASGRVLESDRDGTPRYYSGPRVSRFKHTNKQTKTKKGKQKPLLSFLRLWAPGQSGCYRTQFWVNGLWPRVPGLVPLALPFVSDAHLPRVRLLPPARGIFSKRNFVCVPQPCPSEIVLSTFPQAGRGGGVQPSKFLTPSPRRCADVPFLLQVKGPSTATSAAPPSPRRETCCVTSSCTPGRSLSNVPSVTTPAADGTRSPATSVHTRVSDLSRGKGGVGPQDPQEIELSDFALGFGQLQCLSRRRAEPHRPDRALPL